MSTQKHSISEGNEITRLNKTKQSTFLVWHNYEKRTIHHNTNSHSIQKRFSKKDHSIYSYVSYQKYILWSACRTTKSVFPGRLPPTLWIIYSTRCDRNGSEDVRWKITIVLKLKCRSRIKRGQSWEMIKSCFRNGAAVGEGIRYEMRIVSMWHFRLIFTND